MNSSTPIISVQNVRQAFESPGGTIDVIREAHFDIPDGSFTIIYGPSGSGKSTLLNMLVGLESPSSGSVLYQNRDLYEMTIDERALSRANTMGIVHQSNYWVNSLNVLENVMLPLSFLGMKRSWARKMAHDSLIRVDMDKYANRMPINLSGGEQQRVAMARATVNNPTMIVADEPTGNLDSSNGSRIIELLQYFNYSLQRTVVLVTHNLEYLPVGDQLLTIEDGRTKSIVGQSIEEVSKEILLNTVTQMKHWSSNGKKK